MTADGPDIYTEEFRRVVDKHYKTRYKMTKAFRSTATPPWKIPEDEINKELLKCFKDPRDKNFEIGMKHVMGALYFLNATGGIPATKEQREKLFKLIVPMLKTTEENVSGFLPGLMIISRRLNLKEAYKGGNITPELATILNDSYELTPEFYRLHSLPERSFVLPYLLDEHKLDFSPFKGPDDTGDEWYFNYRIAYTPLPIGTGYNHSTLEQITSKAESDYIKELANLQQSAKRFLEGVRPSERWLKERMHLEGEALEKAKNDYLVKPKDPETLLKFAEAVEMQYQQRLAENTSRDYAAPCSSIYEAGFYVNPATCKIYDLRPYRQEIHSLLSVKDWDYLKDFVNTVREAVREFTEPAKEETAGDGILQSLFPDVYYAPPEEAKNFRNLPVSKAEKRLIPAYASARIDGQGITLADTEGNPLQEIDFTDLNGNISDEVIRPFDISIMNCIGSLQQKYPDKKGFTDIQIAKEFCSTQDKKGNITPASPIVKEVREAMRRLRIVFGRIDITEQLKKEAGRRHPDQKKIDKLVKGSKFFGIAQPLVNVTKVAIQTLKNDKDTLLYIIDGPPLFYLHAAITHQIAPVPYEQMNSKKNLTTEIRLLREQTRIALETAISMRKRKVGGDRIRFNTILDATFRTSADEPQDPAKIDITEVVNRIPEQKRWKLQRQVLQYLDELIQHKFITGYTVLKKKLPGKRKLVEYGFTFTLPED